LVGARATSKVAAARWQAPTDLGQEACAWPADAGLAQVDYEQHTFECLSCQALERRAVFNESRKPIRRLVQIVQHPKYEGSFAAQEYEIWRDYFGSSGPRTLARTM
jgi:hypothetical protein